MTENYEIDDLDKQILELLQRDARMPFSEIARKLIVSGGTIHQRVDRLKESGIIKGSRIVIDHQLLGMDVTVLLGVHLKSSKDSDKVIKKLKQFPEVIEAYYTTGNFALMVKVVSSSIKDFHSFLSHKFQGISEIQSTESFVCLDTPISRDIQVKMDLLSEKSMR
jgi:Lrp/AsnC family transcriptional regulator for asnA, asnC and gidA